MLSIALAEKITASCGIDADAIAQPVQRQFADGHAAQQDATLRVVEAQRELEHRGLAGAAGAHQNDGLAGTRPG